MAEPLWQPSEAANARTALAKDMLRAGKILNWSFANSDEFHAFSVDDTEAFWSLAWDLLNVLGEKGRPPYLVDATKMPGARFFPEGRLNFAENLLAGVELTPGDDRPWLVFRGEDKVRREVGRSELRAMVARVAGALTEAGIGPGDRVAAMLPNVPEAIEAVLGTSATGAVWSSCSPDFGVRGVLDRFGQIGPKAFFVCDGYYYGGKTFDCADKVLEITDSLPSVELIVVVTYIGSAGRLAQQLSEKLKGRRTRVVTWGEAVAARAETAPRFERLPFAHPLFIMFSSGTTGAPKCIVHSTGGVLLKQRSELAWQCDVQAGDRLFFFSTLGWMMWNWTLAALAAGARIMMFDGSPFHPGPDVLWDYAEEERFTHFGTSAKYIDSLKKAGARPGSNHKLADLRVLMSTGSPLAPESFDYVYEAVKKDLHLASMSGGTDILGCFVGGVPLKPVYRNEIQGPAFGMKVEVFDDEGKPRTAGKGELVCTKPFPSMPIGFWGDPADERYRAAYYNRFANIWHHGDFAEWTEHGGMIIHGRSDATLNPQGVRIGTAEIYAQVEELPEIKESIVIGQDWDNDVRVVLFVVLNPGFTLDEALKQKIRQKVRMGASPRHVPAKIVAVRDIPRTKSGKITELAVREIVMGRPVKNKEALANPESLDLYKDLSELKT